MKDLLTFLLLSQFGKVNSSDASEVSSTYL